MGITCILIAIIIVLIAVIIGYKREFRRISKQINNNLDEYANIKTKSVDKDVEGLVEDINLIFDSKQKIVAEKNKNEEELIANKLTVKQLIEGLKKRDKEVIMLRFYKEKTQSEVAKILGITQVQVSRIERKILDNMKLQLTS